LPHALGDSPALYFGTGDHGFAVLGYSVIVGLRVGDFQVMRESCERDLMGVEGHREVIGLCTRARYRCGAI